ncbi:JAB domain-containing protein [Wolbachia endosymbiont of Frankliniella intonsa]|uniref:JAB domain-containing protein n=1 Tax=Wolbachia endosymbiont of Frankliniella intonsa TaxID=2902422 RepID=UPI00244E9C41|nr:JAB domain-containing protein [Wolbachia endosymbiont of Frankliniella intonsa]WGJ61859.1 DNA repair protein RadC [Wolbachia endosymbiont of Frankliniella intonsa]
MNKSKEEIEFIILESKGKVLLDREIMETFLSAVHERPQAQEIAKNLVNSYTGVGRILVREMDDLKVIEGVTDSAVAMIMCVKETLERVLREKLKSDPIMDLQGLVEYLNVSIGHSERECVKILYLNKRRQLIGEESYIGEMEKAPVYIKEITRKALIRKATSIIISHNQPEGRLKPSDEDEAVTKDLAKACQTIGIRLLDHIIITSVGYFSFKEQGLL